MIRAAATAPSSDQIAQIYRDELPLFQPGAHCTLDGTSSAVTALAYDETNDILKIGTSWGTTSMKGLVRTSSEVSTVGAVQSISAGALSYVTAGVTGATYVEPSRIVRAELRQGARAKRVLGKIAQMFDFDTIGFTATTVSGSPTITAVVATSGAPYIGMGFTGAGIPAGTTITNIVGNVYTLSANATASAATVVMGQCTFDLPRGYTANTTLAYVLSSGLKRRMGATKVFIILNNGYYETVLFAVSPGGGAEVCVAAVRNN